MQMGNWEMFPLKLRLIGRLDLSPSAMWMSPDASLHRIGVIGMRKKQFACLEVGAMFAPFMKESTRPIHISDVELLAIVRGMAVWVTDFRGTALGISDDNINALQWISPQRAHHGIAAQILRTTLKRAGRETSISLA